MLITNTLKAVKENNLNKIALCGGVSANSYIREKFKELGKENNLEVYYPELIYCTDNAAMIGTAAYYHYLKGDVAELTLNAVPNLSL